MRVREHFLLGTEVATISVTARNDCTRDALFRHAIQSILERYNEEFGKEAYNAFLKDLAAMTPSSVNWRLKPEDSCWSEIKANHT